MLKLRSSDSLLPKAYGLPKIHKENAPLRVIISSINTALYPLGKFLNGILSDGITSTKYHARNGFELCDALSGKIIPIGCRLVSFDVTSLFTNIPIELAIDSINNRWECIERHTKLSKSEFLAAIEFVLSSTFFKFNEKIYKQTFGTPMGSPLSPIISDLVMRDLEDKVLNSLSTQPIFYYRYVDDIILSTYEEEIHSILEKFNNYHHRLKFTIESEANHCLNFLDITLHIRNNCIITDWYHKITFSGRYLSYFSNHPISHKIGTIYGLVDRAIKLSHPSFYEKNLKFCINVLLDNGYPLDFIFNKINLRLKKLFTQITDNAIVSTEADSINERKIVLLPYVQPLSEFISSNLDKTKAIVAYRCLNKLSRFIKVQKDVDHLSSKSNVIYKIKCNDCDATYVGQTKRQLRTRIREHKNNVKQDRSKHSVISEHITKFRHSFNWDNVKVLDIESKYYKRITSEMIHIKEQSVGLNLNSDTELLDDSYFDILNELAGR